MRRLAGFGLVIASIGAVALGTQACGDDTGDSSFIPPPGSKDGGGVGDENQIILPKGDGSGGDTHQCVNLECKQVACTGQGAGGKTTSISGIVYDPAGKNPLYNVVVYVNNAPLTAITHGATCDKCGSTLSGNPLVATLTDAAGHFSLANVPVQDGLSLVMQVGKWRRVIKIPTVTLCGDTAITDINQSRLARRPAEFDPMDDIPQIAMTTGGADPLECLPRKIGIDDGQFTTNAGTGRVHMYQGAGGSQLKGGSPPVQPFWTSSTNLQKYDIVMLGCEGGTHQENKGPTAMQAMYDYAEMGGRLFGSHFHYVWLESGVKEFPTTATFNHTDMPDPINGTIDTSFPKGQAFSDWMGNVKALNGKDQFEINQPRHDVDSVNMKTSVRWVYNTPENAVLYYSFNTPVPLPPDQQCGKVVYSDLHVSSGDKTGGTFPNNCTTTNLSPQEKALEFMLFDLSSCIQNDTQKPPDPPTPVPN